MELCQQPSVSAYFYFRMFLYVIERGIMQEKEPVSPTQQNPMEETMTYRIEGRSFIVQSVFKKENANTLGEVLLRLMQADRENKI